MKEGVTVIDRGWVSMRRGVAQIDDHHRRLPLCDADGGLSRWRGRSSVVAFLFSAVLVVDLVRFPLNGSDGLKRWTLFLSLSFSLSPTRVKSSSLMN